MLSFCYCGLTTGREESLEIIEFPWKSSDHITNDDVSTISDNGIDTPRSQDSSRSWGCDSMVEICSMCPVPSVAKEGVLELKQKHSVFTRSRKRFFVIRDGCLEIWLTEKNYANGDSIETCISLRDLKDMEQHGNAITLKFLQGGKRQEQLFELRTESDAEAVDWFEAIEYVLRSMSMPINYSLCEMPVFQPSILQDFQRLVDHCFIDKETRDRRGQKLPKGLKVIKVIKVQNAKLLRDYSNMQRQIASELKDRDLQQSYDILQPDVRTSLLDPPLPALSQLDDNTIERWLFHGTSARNIEGIAKSNFDLSRAGSGAGLMYGKGIYCAGCCSKADEYTEEDGSGVRGMLLCRATLGKILHSTAKSPNVSQLQQEKEKQGCHTILGDRWTACGTYREFVFSKNEQLYPEFIIHYQRVY